MRALLSKWLVCAAMALLVASSVMAASPENVAESIRKGREWLLSRQKDGNWEQTAAPENPGAYDVAGGQWGGVTSLATYALLASGESIQNSKVRDAVDFLKRAQIRGIYAIGMRSQVWQFLPSDPEMSACAKRDMQALLDGMLQAPENKGLYDYLTPAKPDDPRVDHSVSQYGVLGAWALEKLGAGFPAKYWQLVEERWEEHQDPSGGWCYDRRPSDSHPISMAMTAAGVATLFITQDFLHANEGIQPRGNITRPTIEAGLKWMSDNFDSTGENWYAWYGIERVGVASGLKYFGPHNWYEQGAELITQRQDADGHWTGPWGGDVASTSFCLLALSRGRAPIMASKLQYEVIDAKSKQPAVGLWNQRPRDLANATHWVGQRVERELNWQIVNLQAPADELIEAPILYLSGSRQLSLSDADKAKLKQYIEDGGMVVANPDGGKVIFTDSFRKLGEELFPQYKFRELPEKHVIYTGQQFQRAKAKVKYPLQALSNGARELMVALPAADLARQWQLNDDPKREEPFHIMANLYLYAVDKVSQYKGERRVLKLDPAVTTDKVISLARLQYEGNWNPEPGGWRRMQVVMHNSHQADLKVSEVKLGEGKLDSHFAVAHLTGTGAIKLTPAQQEELKKYVEGGGVLIVDAAGGESGFRNAVESELTTVLGGEAGKAFSSSLKPDSDLYAAMGEAAKAEYRNYARLELGRLPKEPRLRGLEVNGKYRVIYSPQDMTAGLLGQPVDGIFGYSPKSATDIMASLLLYAGK